METLVQRRPLYSQIKEVIKKKIEKKEFRLYEKLPGEVELASQFNVSIPTVRHALDELVKEGQIVRKKKKGTIVVNPFEGLQIDVVYSSSLPRKSEPTRGIGFTLFLDTFRGITERAVELKLNPQYLRVSEGKEGMNYLLNRISTRKQPIIFLGPHGYEEIVAKLHQLEHPYVIARHFNLDNECNSIIVDYKSGCQEAIEYLIQLGHKTIGFIFSGSMRNQWLVPRFEGYKKALEQNQIALKPELIKEANEDLKKTYQAVDELLSLRKRPTAIFTTADQIALWVMESLKQKKIKVPGDISIIGFDNIREASETEPPLTTADGKRYESGAEALNLLLKIMNKQVKLPARFIIKPELIVRKSCSKI